MRAIRRRKKSTAEIFKMMSLALLGIAFPVTFFLFQNQTFLTQNASESGSVVITITPTPTPLLNYFPENVIP